METELTLRRTPLYAWHVAAGAKMSPFGGWLMPIQYDGIIAEHLHTRTAVSLFDTCHMGQFVIEADAVACGLDRLVTQRIADAPVGACRYGFFLNEAGGILDDLIVCRLGERRWLLVVNAATARRDAAHLMQGLSDPSCLNDLTGEMGKIDVQGPLSAEAVSGIAGAAVRSLRYYEAAELRILGAPAVVARTGYTGELGYEILMPSSRTLDVWERLLADGRAKPAGLGARDVLRLEMGYPLYGQDIDERHTPLEAGLERFVDFRKEFVGRQALLCQRSAGTRERLACLLSSSRRAPRRGQPVFFNGARIGSVTSGSFSPARGAGIGMGYLARWRKGTVVTVGEGSAPLEAMVVRRPFVEKRAV